MKLLIITQKIDINDDVLGFFHSWILAFSKKCESILAICLKKGQYQLPENVKVVSLGKESGESKSKYFFNFYKYIWKNRKEYDAVFVHMNPIYIVLGGWLWKFWGKKIILWYTHRQVDLKLRIAEKFSDVILTASKESFCLKSAKVKVLGHGIDIEKFVPIVQDEKNGKFNIVYAGRISKIKNQELLVKTVDYLANQENIKNIRINFFGSPIYQQDKEYFEKLKKFINEKKLSEYIFFNGSAPYWKMAGIFQQADLTINLCPTGGLDKAVLESMACGVPAIVFNKSFQDTLSVWQKELILVNPDEKELAEKIVAIKNWDFDKKKIVSQELRESVARKHSLDNLVEKIIMFCK